MDYLVFNTQQDADLAAEVIYSNMVEAINSPSLLNVNTWQVVDKDDLTPDEAVQINANQRYFPVFGVNAASGLKDERQGYTTAWAKVRETLQGEWVFPKPDDSLLNGVGGYTVKPYDPAWFADGGYG